MVGTESQVGVNSRGDEQGSASDKQSLDFRRFVCHAKGFGICPGDIAETKKDPGFNLEVTTCARE